MSGKSIHVGLVAPSDPVSEIDRRDFLRQSGLAAVAVASASLASSAVGSASGIWWSRAAGASEIVGWDADTLSQRIKARAVSCVEVMDAYLAQIKRLNPRVNAIVAMPDEADLRAQAEERDAQLARGEYLGWMHGMPQAVKDTAQAKGLVYTSGSLLLKGHVSDVDAIIVERAKKAGAVIIGKTNVPEWALGSNTFNRVYGTTNNPYNLVKTVGGSSGGAAASLAARMLPVADGSDMGGSIRNPSAFCNAYGLRPTAGVVPFGPSPEVFVQQIATEGPLGRTVKDVAMLLSIQAGHDPRAPLSVKLDPSRFAGPLAGDVKGKKIAWMGDWNGYFATEPGVLDLCRSTLKVFEDLGCNVEEALPEFDPAELWDMWLTHRAWIVGNYLGAYYKDPAKRELMGDNARWEAEQSLNLSAAEVFASSVSRSDWAGVLRDFFAAYDFAVAPTAQVFPFDSAVPWPKEVGGRTMQTYHQWMGIVLPWSLAGTPVMNVPAGFSENGLPMGIQIIGKRHADLDVLKMAYAYEQATGWVQKRPPAILV
jgi:amidase